VEADDETQFNSHCSHGVLPTGVSEIKTFMNTWLRVTGRVVCSYYSYPYFQYVYRTTRLLIYIQS